MNILIINYEYPPLGGGGGVFTLSLAEELAKTNKVDLITSHFGTLKRRETVRGVNIYRVPVLGKRSLQSAGLLSLVSFPLSAISAGLKIIKKNNPDIINSHFAVPTGPAGCFLSRVSGKKNVLNILGGDIYDPTKKLSPHRNFFLRWVVRRVLNSSDLVIAESNDIATRAKSIYRPKKDILVCPIGFSKPPCDPVREKVTSRVDDKIHLISVGRMVKRKGFDFLIRALAMLKDIENHVHLTLVGDGPELKSLKQLSKELKVRNNITFTGSLPDEDKFRLLSSSDICVLPSIHEGFGIVLLEAMYYGLAVISTNRGGQTDIIKNGKNGILVPIGDEKSLADAIRELTLDTDKRKKIGSYNKDDIKNYEISTTTRKLVDIFRNLLET
jgi:L-malate glycosyltransferase